MFYNDKEIILKDGKKCLLRSPKVKDAEEMLEYLKICASETEFILRYPEECTDTVEQEEKFLQDIINSENNLMIVAIVDDEIAGNCSLHINNRMKTRHRGSVAIALKKKYWNKGIGTAMFNELIEYAKKHGCIQLELEFIEGNDRARALYEKFGFSIFAERKRAIKLKDNRFLSIFFMVKYLD